MEYDTKFNKKIKKTKRSTFQKYWFYKKEILKFGKEKEKLQRSLGGIVEMKKTPDLIFIIDTNISPLLLQRRRIRYPYHSGFRFNSDPTGIDFLFRQ